MSQMVQAIAPVSQIDRAGIRAVFLSSLGGALEFYDFIVFGTFAAYISKAFFPANDPVVSLLLTFGLFAAGYLARPIGGIVFGGRGDRVRRRHSFLLSLATMSLATMAMGLVPSYATGGVTSTLVFVALRLIQGFCLGGELPGAITYAVEVVPRQRATLAVSVTWIGLTLVTLAQALRGQPLLAPDGLTLASALAVLVGAVLVSVAPGRSAAPRAS